MKHYFVINPHSFVSIEGIKKVIFDIKNTFPAEQRDDYEIYISRRPRSAIASVSNFLRKTTRDETVRIYAIGGDGILFDCLNGMIKYPNAELTSVPYGRVNDFVRSFGNDVTASFRDIKSLSVGPSQRVDVINIGSNFALCHVIIGHLGQAINLANSFLNGKNNKWVRYVMPNVYTIAALFAMTKTKVMKQKYEIKVDDEYFSGKFSNINISNIALDGGSFIPIPYAKPNDGVLDVLITTNSNPLKILTLIHKRNTGKFESSKHFRYKKCKSMNIKSEEPLFVCMDGEAFFIKDLEVKILHKGLNFFTPEGMNFVDYSLGKRQEI